MRDTMRDAPGVGLAAPQIGLALQLAVIEDRAEYHSDIPAEVLRERDRAPVGFHVIINPVIELGEQRAEFFEGCLSMPGYTAIVPRARSVTVEALNERAERVRLQAKGWYARILQHEIDHMNGTVYVDRMRSRSLMTTDNFTRYWKSKTSAQVCEDLAI